MVCATAAGMTITIHGSLVQACTQRTHMRGAEGDMRRKLEVKMQKNPIGVKERAVRRKDDSTEQDII